MKENLFADAIKKNELLHFAQGKGRYFILDRENGEHWVLGSWLNHIIPFYHNDKENCRKGIKEMFMNIVNIEDNPEKEACNFLYHVYTCHYLISEGRIKDLSILMEEMEAYFIKNIEKIKRLIPPDKVHEINASIKMIKNKGGLKNY